jgi:hypothetical protein
MSQENVEAMRVAMEAFNRRDADAFGAFFADDAEIVPVRAAFGGDRLPGSRRGGTALVSCPWSSPTSTWGADQRLLLLALSES